MPFAKITKLAGVGTSYTGNLTRAAGNVLNSNKILKIEINISKIVRRFRTMKLRISILVLLILGSAVPLAAHPDSAIVALTGWVRTFQQEAMVALPGWEAINLGLASPQFSPQEGELVWQQENAGLLATGQRWSRHAPTLPRPLRDTLSEDLHRLSMLRAKISEANQRLFGYVSQRAWQREAQAESGIAYLDQIAVALEDANVLALRIEYHLNQYLLQALQLPQSDPLLRARQYFSQGLTLSRTLLHSIRTNRREETRTALAEFRAYRLASPQRRVDWLRRLAPEDRLRLEAHWVRWENQLQWLEQGAQDWLAGRPAPASGSWPRHYLWYNHGLLPRFCQGENSLLGQLSAFWAATGRLLQAEVGLFPAYRVQLPEASAAIATAQPRHWIFVVDESGSMQEAERLPLFRQSLAAWASQLPGDHLLSLVGFADTQQVRLQAVPAARIREVWAQTSQLGKGGETNVQAALTLGYDLAGESALAAAVVLVSDGGMRYDAQLAQLAEEQWFAGITLYGVFLPGQDARYRNAFRTLVRAGGGQVQELRPGNSALHWDLIDAQR